MGEHDSIFFHLLLTDQIEMRGESDDEAESGPGEMILYRGSRDGVGGRGGSLTAWGPRAFSAGTGGSRRPTGPVEWRWAFRGGRMQPNQRARLKPRNFRFLVWKYTVTLTLGASLKT
jgi:hypothetical protein